MEILLPTSGMVVRPSKLLCIGRNYARHAAEMKSDVPTQPVVFLKPPSALLEAGGTVTLPRQSAEVHHEVELVVAVGKRGKDIREEEALSHVDGYAVGLDMTARDIQLAAKKAGQPWSVAKGFDTFAPLGRLAPASDVSDPQKLRLQLKVNDELRQNGSTGDMIFPVAHLIAYLSGIFTLMPGDLIFTGTPEGVGPVADGDRLEATAENLPPLKATVRTT